MDISRIPVGVNPPYDVNALIEIPQGGAPVKYELDKASGAMFVDRFLHTAMFYPGNYGFIPHTLSGDGDPIDILVVGPTPVATGAIIRCRPIGCLIMVDEAGEDEKVLAVPVDKLHPYYAGIDSWRALPSILTEQVAHRFGIPIRLEFYSTDELMKVLAHAAGRLGLKLTDASAYPS